MTRYLNYKRAAEYLDMPEGTLRSMVSHGKIPHSRLGPRTVRFDVLELDKWLDGRKVHP